jgi:predicted RNA binding protein YcfA (HicA-like mRNA interferase family)
MAKKYREVSKALRKTGWSRLRTVGSHEIWGDPHGRRVVVAGGGNENDDVSAGTVRNIRRSTGVEELR